MKFAVSSAISFESGAGAQIKKSAVARSSVGFNMVLSGSGFIVILSAGITWIKQMAGEWA